ncbi:type II secretion system F family protein [Janibacter indicus]|uniref:Type II secretion system F family protein n=1 Tax=Janibacter indicus TaxID=857417 RepID=A0A1L3MI49_9MICO|nr:type II secretion system F family protein [Janibacter indicus]APH01979.1 type II secretion system protein F [Janibacter indicus]QOK21910.1 type II secretion system F family protein [Janibacter indicus]
MTGVLVGAILGAGVFLIWWSCWPREERERVQRESRVMRGLADDLAQAGYRGIGPRLLLAACGIAFLLIFLTVTALTGVPAIALCFAVMAGWVPVAVVRVRARSRRAHLRDLWPDAVDNVTSAVRAGLALPEALAQLSVRGPEELRPAFADFASDYRTTGRFNDCLDRLKDRLADPVGDRLVESLRIAREVGGSDLGSLLRTLSTFLREDARTRSELETRQSWTVNAARLAVAAPWIVLALLSTRPESVQAYNTSTGVLVLAVGAVATVVAYRIMVRIGRLPEEERVLR